MAQTDYYTTLGLSKDATQDDIKKAYRRLARKYHPDVSKRADAGECMAQINEANEVLSDPKKRSVYDQIGAAAWAQGARSTDDVRPPPGWRPQHEGHHQSSEDFSGFFHDMFNESGRARQHGQQGWPGQDTHADITITLQDAYEGTTRTLHLRSTQLDAQGRLTPQTRTIETKIPAGVAQGQLIRLSGQGEPGMGQGKAGDLYLKVNIETQDRVHVSGRDVYMPLPVTPWEAALGAEIAVNTPSGRIHVSVPAGSVAKRKLRLRGKGIPGAKPGDIMLELEIAIPSAVTSEQKSAWEALAKAYPGFNPRPH